jgi:hypothetical protein
VAQQSTNRNFANRGFQISEFSVLSLVLLTTNYDIWLRAVENSIFFYLFARTHRNSLCFPFQGAKILWDNVLMIFIASFVASICHLMCLRLSLAILIFSTLAGERGTHNSVITFSVETINSNL